MNPFASVPEIVGELLARLVALADMRHGQEAGQIAKDILGVVEDADREADAAAREHLAYMADVEAGDR